MNSSLCARFYVYFFRVSVLQFVIQSRRRVIAYCFIYVVCKCFIHPVEHLEDSKSLHSVKFSVTENASLNDPDTSLLESLWTSSILLPCRHLIIPSARLPVHLSNQKTAANLLWPCVFYPCLDYKPINTSCLRKHYQRISTNVSMSNYFFQTIIKIRNEFNIYAGGKTSVCHQSRRQSIV